MGEETVYKIEVSNDQQYISARMYRKVAVFEFNTGNLLYTKDAEAGGLFTPDSKSVVVTTEDGSITQWDISGEKNIHVFEIPCQKIRGIDLSSDGNFMLVGCDSSLVLWHLKEKKIIRQFSGDEYKSNGGIRFFPKSPKILISNFNQIEVMDYFGNKIGKPITQLTNRSIWSLKISPDEQFLLGAVGDHYLVIWNLNTREFVSQNTYNHWIWDVCFTPDGKEYGFAGQFPPVFLNFNTQKKVISFDGLMSRIINIEQSSDYGQFLIQQSDDDAHKNDYLFIEAKTFKMDTICHNNARSASISVSNGDLFTIYPYNELPEVWDKSTQKKKYSFPQNQPSENANMVISPDGNFVLIENNKTAQLFTSDGVLKQQLQRYGYSTECRAVFSSKGKYISIFGRNAFIPSIFKGESLHPLPYLQYPGNENFQEGDDYINYVAFSPDEKTLAGTTLLGDIYVWDIESGKIRHILTGSKLAMVTFSPDNLYIMGSYTNYSAKIWRLSDGTLLKTLTQQQAGDPNFIIDSEFKVWKWMKWAFFLP